MNFRFPLKDVDIELATKKKEIKSPAFNDGFYILNQNEFSMDVPDVAWFYVSGGNFISIVPYPDADKNSIELYLNGSVYGAILHQRKILPLHGSSFIWKGQGIMLCGESGAGKSSLTTAFCLNGAEFLTDDVTPIVFENNIPNIFALSDRIKLWENTLVQLDLGKEGLSRIDPETDKFYFPIDPGTNGKFLLNHIFILEVHDDPKAGFQELTGAEKFSALRNEIYRWEYLEAMAETEAGYFDKILSISKYVNVIKVRRPVTIALSEFQKILELNIEKNQISSRSELPR